MDTGALMAALSLIETSYHERATMLLNVTVPLINVHMTVAQIVRVHAGVGDALAPGAKLFDIGIDLSSAFPQDCPPVSFYRIILRERAWVRAIVANRGDEPAANDRMALLSTEPDEPIDAAPTRAARITTAGIMWQPSWSTAEA